MQILSVNVGVLRTVTIKGQAVQTGLYKIPQNSPVSVTRLGLQNDVYVEPRPMGEAHHAVYAYPYEHYAYWQNELQREPFPMGQFGENLTVTGLLEDEVRIGDIFRFGTTILQVAQPRIPCAKLNDRMGMRFAPIFFASCKVGYYMRVLQEGTVAQGDSIELLERDENSPTMEEFIRVIHYEYWDAEALQNLLRARDLMDAWRETIELKLAKTRSVKGWHGLRKLEIVRRVVENDDTISLYLKCAKGKPLAPYHGGQKLTIVLGGHTPHQERRAYALSGNPCDLSEYRITVRRMLSPDPTMPHGIVSSHLFSLKPGDHILSTAPHGILMRHQKYETHEYIPVLISYGLGIASMLSLLYELVSSKIPRAYLLHMPASNDPPGLLNEIHELVQRNPDFKMIQASAESLSAALLSKNIDLSKADINIMGPRSFVENLGSELEAAGLDPSVIKLLSFG